MILQVHFLGFLKFPELSLQGSLFSFILSYFKYIRTLLLSSLPLPQPPLQWQCVQAAEIFLFWLNSLNFLYRHGLLPSETVYFLIETGSLILNNCVPVHGNQSTGSLNPYWLIRLQKCLYQNNVKCHDHSKQITCGIHCASFE